MLPTDRPRVESWGFSASDFMSDSDFESFAPTHDPVQKLDFIFVASFFLLTLCTHTHTYIPLPSAFTLQSHDRSALYHFFLHLVLTRERTTRFPYSPILLVREIRRIDIYSKHVRIVFDMMKAESMGAHIHHTHTQEREKKNVENQHRKTHGLNVHNAQGQAFAHRHDTTLCVSHAGIYIPIFRLCVAICVHSLSFSLFSLFFFFWFVLVLALILHNHRISIENKCFGRNPFRVPWGREPERIKRLCVGCIVAMVFVAFSLFHPVYPFCVRPFGSVFDCVND